MAIKYASLSPYNFSFNDPVTFNDPSGADPPQTVNYGARNSGWFTSYTYDDRVDYDRGEWFHGGSSSAMSFHFGGRNGSVINWSYTPQHYSSNVFSFLAAAWENPNGGHWNSETGGFLFSNDLQALTYGFAYQDRHNSWYNTVYGNERGTIFAYHWAELTGDLPVKATVDYHLTRTIENENWSGTSFTKPGAFSEKGKHSIMWQESLEFGASEVNAVWQTVLDPLAFTSLGSAHKILLHLKDYFGFEMSNGEIKVLGKGMHFLDNLHRTDLSEVNAIWGVGKLNSYSAGILFDKIRSKVSQAIWIPTGSPIPPVNGQPAREWYRITLSLKGKLFHFSDF